MTLSGYWAQETHRALRGASSVEARLAIALTPVRSVIRVVDDSRPPMSVDWCQVGKDDKGRLLSKSYTDFGNRRIAVNPAPIIEGILSSGAALDVVCGFALHEASHAKHSRDRWQYLIKKDPARGTLERDGQDVPAFTPMRIASYLWNLVEDVRIEDRTTREWRGFGPYFTNLLNWMWTSEIVGKDHVPLAYGPKLADKIKVIFTACRFPEQATALDAALQPEIAWWQAWQHDYLTDAVDTPTTIQRGLDRLAEDPDTEAEMDRMAAEEEADRKAGEQLRRQIERLMAEGIPGTPAVCINENGEFTVLSETTAEKIRELVKEGLVEVVPFIPHGRGATMPTIRVSKPIETPASRRAFIGKPDAATEALRASLVFRSERPRYDVKLQRSGTLDDEELYRFGLGDRRLFTDRVIEAVPDTLLGLLVDLSGSMTSPHSGGRTKVATAQRLAQLFLWATHDMEGVSTRVWGHSGDGYEHGDGADIYRLWEPGDPMRRLGLIATLDHGDNYDGYAVAWCADQMRRESQPQKVLLVLSDGYPAGHNYGGREAERHLRAVTTWAASQGVSVIQIAIDEDLRPTDQERMYGPGNWLPYTNEKQLPRDLAQILARFTK